MKTTGFIVAAISSMPLLTSPCAADAVFKCTVNGKTVYQQVPCTGDSKTVDLVNATAPTEAERIAAQNRNQRLQAEIARREAEKAPKKPEKKERSRGGMSCFQTGRWINCN